MIPRLFFSLFLYALFIVSSVNSGKVLVYSPSLSKSHLISNGRIADALVDAGHEVVMVIVELETLTEFTGTKKAKVVTISNYTTIYMDALEQFDSSILTTPFMSFTERHGFEDLFAGMCTDLLTHKLAELEELRAYNFDVAFSEMLDFCGVGVIRYLGIKNHLWISTTPLMDSVSYTLGIPAPPSYVPTIEESRNSDRMSFWQRAENLYMYIGATWIHRYAADQITEVFRKLDPDFPNVREIAANSSLCFVNSDEMLDLPRPIITKTIFIGGLGVSPDARPLDEKFAKILEKGKKGVVLFSLGSVAQFGVFPKEIREGVLQAIKEMPDYHFLVKMGRGDNSTLLLARDIPNVEFTEWMPQVDLLAHPRLKLFVMHGGINGILETAPRGVPTVVVPIFADQYRNGLMLERRGIGKVLPKWELGYENFKKIVGEVLGDQSYEKNAKRIGKLMREKPFSAEDRLVKWTEFAMNNGVLEELHVEGSRLNTIVYFNLDILLVLVAFVLVVLYGLRYIARIVCGRSERSKDQQKAKLQ